MPIDKDTYTELVKKLSNKNVTLIAVSKTKTAEDILALYELGQRDFGENYVQELLEKQSLLPKDIRWHFIGHLQTNKVKYIAPFVHLIHGTDSYKLLLEINKQGVKNNRIIHTLLQVHIAKEETKFGVDEIELDSILQSLQKTSLSNVFIDGLMGMASFTDNKELVRQEFCYLSSLFKKYAQSSSSNVKFETLSMGMSDDYTIAVEEGSNMVRIGSLLFGTRQ